MPVQPFEDERHTAANRIYVISGDFHGRKTGGPGILRSAASCNDRVGLGGMMALYAFDGTWNSDKPGTEKDTNVVWFHDAYTGPKHYWSGVGTRLGLAGKLVGGITGAG